MNGNSMGALAAAAVIIAGAHAVAQQPQAYQVPRIEGIVIDGDAADWKDRGFHIVTMTDEKGRFQAAEDFRPRMRLGWNEQGLLILAEVDDDVAAEEGYIRRLFMGDSVEYFIASRYGAADYYMVVIAPGSDDDGDSMRHIFFDERTKEDPRYAKLGPLKMSCAVRRAGKGYCVETLLPWSNLEMKAKLGTELAFQAYAMDRDEGKKTDYVTWHGRHDTHENRTTSMYPIVLSERPSEPADTAVRLHARLVEVAAPSEAAGQQVQVRSGEQLLAEGPLERSGSFATRTLSIPAPKRDQHRVEVFRDGRKIASLRYVHSPPIASQAIERGRPEFYQYVFSGRTFPRLGMRDQAAFRKIAGEAKIETSFYDEHFQKVTTADSPGRYGAVITVTPEHGRATCRFQTLFRTPADAPRVPRAVLPYWVNSGVYAGLDEGVLPASAAKTASKPDSQPELKFADQAGMVYAARFEARDQDEDPNDLAIYDQIDRQWWVRFKRQYYGTDERWPDARVAPRDEPMHDALVLREGTCDQAGMDPKVVGQIDELASEWSELTGEEGFGICIARNGVVFYHKVFGEVDGQPMTKRTQVRVYSMSKAYTSALTMMCLDRGLIDLDVPLDQYLPPLADITVPVPMTLRHLLTHTSGLPFGHKYRWMSRELEEAIADLYASVDCGVTHSYSTVGFMVIGNLLEQVTGETYQQLATRALLDPLTCYDTTPIDATGGYTTTAMDLAKFSQLMLNGGAYGSRRFFSEEWRDAMLPKRLTKTLGPDTTVRWGFGFGYWGTLSGDLDLKTRYTRPTYNSSRLTVLPPIRVVSTVVCAGSQRWLDETQHQKLERIIMDHVRDPATATPGAGNVPSIP